MVESDDWVNDSHGEVEVSDMKKFTTLLDKWTPEIKKNCSEYLSQGNGVLIRGSKSMDNTSGGRRSVRKDRNPVDASKANQIVWDIMFSELGAPKRSESMFATSMARHQADCIRTGYGHTFVVFPVGVYNASYLDRVRDLFDSCHIPFTGMDDLVKTVTTYNDLLSAMAHHITTLSTDKEILSAQTSLEEVEDVYKFITRSIIVGKDISGAISEEITIDCDEYIFVPVGRDCSPAEVQDELHKRGLAPKTK